MVVVVAGCSSFDAATAAMADSESAGAVLGRKGIHGWTSTDGSLATCSTHVHELRTGTTAAVPQPGTVRWNSESVMSVE